jgi:hydroxymethylpyrimidine/phosphomethylpyrimidine kinase
MSKNLQKPVALTIAGSDSGGGAGIQADLKTFAALGVHGTCAITCITAQNPREVSRMAPCAAGLVRAQLEAVFSWRRPAAAKTGLLASPATIREVAKFFRQCPGVPLVVDPVMVATCGIRFLSRPAVEILRRELLPLATLVTPNVAEAEVLTGKRIRTPEDLRASARNIHETFGCAALVKGGHLVGATAALDSLCGKDGEWIFSAPRIRSVKLHGTGCTYSAAITAGLARGQSLMKAIELAKTHITNVISTTC